MKNKKTLALLILLFNAILCFGQSDGLKIRFISNCGLHLTDGASNIYIDFPYRSGAFNYDEYDESELDRIEPNAIFIFTHTHGDHYSSKNMKTVLKNKKGKKYGKWNIPELEKLGETIPGFEIKTFRTKHRFCLTHYSYLITWHGKRIFLSGDTEHAETIGTMKDLDWAFIPVWLLVDSMEKEIKIDSKMIGIYHIGPKDNINITGDKVLMLNRQGQEIIISN
ncbi:MAG: hypothetical protein R2792_14740 [Saprospiraceae bacterium]